MAELSRLRYFTEEEVEKLIELVQKYPVLYDSSVKNYKNSCVQAQAWNSISSQFSDCVPNDVTYKWKTLKDKFLRMRKLYCPEGASCELVLTKWNLYGHISFLNKHLKHRQRSNNLLKKVNTKEGIPFVDNVESIGKSGFVVDLEEEPSSFLELSISPTQSVPIEIDPLSPAELPKRKIDVSSDGPSKKKRDTKQQECRSKQIENDGFTVLITTKKEERKNKEKSPVLDECQAFCLRYAHQMASITDYESREELKNGMERLYYKIKYNNSSID